MFAKLTTRRTDFCCSFSPSISQKMNAAAMAVVSALVPPPLQCTFLRNRLSEFHSLPRNLFLNILLSQGDEHVSTDRRTNTNR